MALDWFGCELPGQMIVTSRRELFGIMLRLQGIIPKWPYFKVSELLYGSHSHPTFIEPVMWDINPVEGLVSMWSNLGEG